MNRPSTYDKFPTVNVPGAPQCSAEGWDAVVEALRRETSDARVVVVETYPGTLDDEVVPQLKRAFADAMWINARDAMKDEATIRAIVQPDVTDDAVFGVMTRLTLRDFFDVDRLALLAEQAKGGSRIVIYGVGASLVHPGDAVVYLDLARWEIQRRQRKRLISNLGVDNRADGTWRKYKSAYFVDWRVADAHKRAIWDRIDLFLDTNTPGEPKLVDAASVKRGLTHCTSRPFRVVPFFDPGVWGGQWMIEVCDLPRDAVNYAWCFDCVPEENSLLLQFGDVRIELPSINLVHQHPRALLGEAVFGRFGAEFPIRFDFLDTMDGGNLSLQVHPLTDYVYQHFGMRYTQDESYYMLDAKPGACVYLGFKSDVVPEEFVGALRDAQSDSSTPLDAERFVNRIPAKKHDHFLIPAGTIHCSGRDSMVLEISATPYIFTFKLWDWGRLDLDGKPRPINVEHGARNLQYDRDTAWTHANLVNRVTPIAEGEGWREERTGLHEAEFIETRRHWFSSRVEHDTHGTVNVLNLVEGEEITVESPTGAFEPFVVHYAETFIVPAAVGRYTIRPSGASVGRECATVKAFVRSNP